MKVRRLNENGILKFEEFIENLRNKRWSNTPHYLLTDESTSVAISDSIEVEDLDFPTRYDLGVYLDGKFSGFEMQKYLGDKGFWSWLALFWFDQLCPAKSDGSRKAQMPYNYILSTKWLHRPRHAVFTTWQLVSQFGEACRFLLSKKLETRGEIIEQMMARRYFISCDGVIRLASKLYLDESTKTFKKGSAGRNSRGCVNRYVGWLQQIELNYDLLSISVSDLEEMLPSEFDRFRS